MHLLRPLLCQALVCSLLLPGLWTPASAVTKTRTETFSTTAFKDAQNTTADWNTAAGELRLLPLPADVGNTTLEMKAVGVAVSGNLAFVAANVVGLAIFDISDPANPVSLGVYDTPGTAEGVCVAGDLAFVADGTSGLMIIDVTNPAAPFLKGSYNTSGTALAVSVAGNLAFVADGTSGLQIINISNPSSPTLKSTFNTEASASDVVVAGDFAFVANGTRGLMVVNVSNPTLPALAGFVDSPGTALGVAVAGDLAFLADGASGLEIIDITDPALPRLAGGYDTPGNANDVAVTGHLAYVADGTAGIQVLDVSDPTTPLLQAALDTPGTAYDIALAGRNAVVADYYTMRVLRISALTAPVSEYQYWTSEAVNVAIDGGLAYLAIRTGADAGVMIFDITEPTLPIQIGRRRTTSALGVAVSGDILALADQVDGLYVIDVSDPTTPTILGVYAGSGFQDVAIDGDLAFVADAFTSTLNVIDISNPAAPMLIGTLATASAVTGVAVAGDMVLLANYQEGLTIVDVTNPASPVAIGNCHPAFTVARDVAVAGDLAFVADSNWGLQVISIANPSAPTLVAIGETPGDAGGIAVMGDLVFVADFDPYSNDILCGLRIFDVRDPANPILKHSLPLLGDAWNVAVSGNHAFVAANYSLDVVRVLDRDLAADENIGQSLPLDQDSDPIRRARLTATQTAGVTWEVSANNGASWQAIPADNTWTVLTTPGEDLVWRSTHEFLGVNPTVTELRVDWLYSYGTIDAITDIPNDQGNQVRIEWTRSGHDFVGDATQIVEYAVYRKIDPAQRVVAAPMTPESFSGLSPAARENASMMLAAGWDFVTTVPVLVEDSYAVVVPTLADSSIVSGQHFTTFRVTALTATPGVFFHSPPDSGYSVDNLAPSAPGNFAVAYNTGGGNALSWANPVDADFRYFSVYRSSDPAFTPSPATLVHTTTATGWTDADHRGGVYYRVTATDFSGNESGPSAAGTTTAVDGGRLPAAFALHPAVPNPFNPSTTLRYDIPPGGASVTLAIFDVAGRLVRTLVSGIQPAGEHTVTWDGRDDRARPVASGVYFSRFVAPGYASTHKLVLMK